MVWTGPLDLESAVYPDTAVIVQRISLWTPLSLIPVWSTIYTLAFLGILGPTFKPSPRCCSMDPIQGGLYLWKKKLIILTKSNPHYNNHNNKPNPNDLDLSIGCLSSMMVSCEPPLRSSQSRDGSAKNFRIAFAFALLVKAHRIALFSHRIRIALFALFSHFRTFSTFLVDISRLMHEKVVKSARKLHKICKKKCENAKKCEMRMRCENGIKIRIALHRTTVTKKIAFSRFFASHSHRTTIPVAKSVLASVDSITTMYGRLGYLPRVLRFWRRLQCSNSPWLRRSTLASLSRTDPFQFHGSSISSTPLHLGLLAASRSPSARPFFELQSSKMQRWNAGPRWISQLHACSPSYDTDYVIVATMLANRLRGTVIYDCLPLLEKEGVGNTYLD